MGNWMGNPGNERASSESAYKHYANPWLTPVLHIRGEGYKETSESNNWKAEKIRKIFQLCQHRQERVESLSPSKLEGLGYYF